MDRFRYLEYWIGWLMVIMGGFGFAQIGKSYTPFALFIFIPMSLTGFYITVIKQFPKKNHK